MTKTTSPAHSPTLNGGGGGGGGGGVEVGIAEGSELATTLASFIRGLDPGGEFEVTAKVALNNPLLRLSFQNALELMEGKHADTGSLFRKQGWKDDRDPTNLKQRKRALAHLAAYVGHFRAGTGTTAGDRP